MLFANSKPVFSQKQLVMNIAIIGYGRMGHELETIAIERGHAIKLIVDQDNTDDLNETKLKGIDIAIEFSSPDAAFSNIIKCLIAEVPVVSGTTGWLKDYNKVKEMCISNNTSFLHSSNFSIGVNILFRLNKELAKQMDRYHNYHPRIEEIHHAKKLDAPSGTAITLADGISENHEVYKSWLSTDEDERDEKSIPVGSLREGEVIGIHSVLWESTIDTIMLKHEAKNRKGLALGAIVAAEFIYSKKGIFTMDDVLGF
jgi:4-hydroxy-tetrahydrodipicolinate reductase